jgi:aspartyl-tRNA(Asn)/glutamyl-tRNA(Gln) amidotransferase subunit C
MTLTKEDVKKISELCRIELTEDEIEKFQKELSVILGYVSELNQVDTEGVEEIAQVTGLENVFREDVSEQSELREKIIQNFPDKKDTFLKIKNIL